MKKKILIDMLLNIIATAIPVFILQLLILPSLSNYMTDEKYGLLVTILALLNIVPSTMGNALNNIRLIWGKDGKPETDYNALLIILAIINILIVTFFSFYYDKDLKILQLILTLAVSLLWLAREYYIVTFRIKINYKNIVISNLIMVLGYGIGYLLFIKFHNWQLIYICGLLISLLYIFIKSDLWKEPLKRTSQFKNISLQTSLLLISNILTRITTYADKMLIFPILGGATVSIYYAATLFGKVVSMAINPVSSVILSYLSKITKKNDTAFKLAFLSSSIICFIGYFVCLAISRPILNLLYPKYVDAAMQYITVTTGTVVLTALISIINPFVLKFFDMKWQVAINGCYVAIYVSLSLGLLYLNGLLGFCIGSLIATAIKLLFMLIVYKKCKLSNVV